MYLNITQLTEQVNVMYLHFQNVILNNTVKQYLDQKVTQLVEHANMM